MPQMSNLAAGRLSSLLRLVLIAAAPFVLAACANKEAQPDSAQLGPGGGAITPGTQRDFATNVGDIVYFSTDSTDLTPEAQQTLQKQAQWLRQYPQFTITIEGHADERGTDAYNYDLSRERLETVASLLKKGGYTGTLTLSPKGKSEPYMGVDRSRYPAEALYQLDRRVELRVIR